MGRDRRGALHLLVRSAGGGAETNVQRLCARTRGFEARSLEELMGWPLDWRRLPAVLLSLRRMRPRVVFCYGATAHLVACLAWPMPGTVLVGGVRSTYDFEGKKGLLRRLMAPRFGGWISNSHAGLAGWPGRVIHNGTPEPPDDEAPLLDGLAHPVFGLMGRGDPVKGHAFMLDLWTGLGCPGTLVFGGDLGEPLRQRAEAAGALCPGFVDAGGFLRSIDLLVVPSSAEGAPTAVIEAMIRGVPVLATPVGGTPELIQHGRTGYLLERERWSVFLRGIDWDKAMAVGEAGRREAMRRFTFRRMQREFVEAAREAARTGRIAP